MTDYDIEYGNDYTTRQYTLETIKKITQILNKNILECVKVDPADVIAYITEKEKPTIEYLDDKEKTIKRVKDGFHICYAFELSVEQRYLIFDLLKKKMIGEDTLKDIPHTNGYDEIVDESTINRNNWMMYGSRKALEGHPPGQIYKLTHVFDVEMNEIDINDYTFEELVKLLSVRQYDGSYCLKTRKTKVAELEEVINKYRLRQTKTDKKPVPRACLNTTQYVNSPNNIETINKLVDMLSVKRAEYEPDWIQVCWVLHNLDASIFDVFDRFSQRGGAKYDKNSCIKAWNDTKPNNYSIATLHWWAQHDSPEGYLDFVWNSVDPNFHNLSSGKSVDIATLVYELYKYRFKCGVISSKHDGWYEFKDHRWVPIECARELRSEISGYVSNRCLQNSQAIDKQMMSEATNPQLLMKYGGNRELMDKILRKTAETLRNVAYKLRETATINNVITECEFKFLDRDFMKNLNSDNYLIGFNNGIFDLRTGEFRDGRPEDNVSFTVGYDWHEYDAKDEVIGEIENYLKTVFPRKPVKEYVLRFIASFAKGQNTDQLFSFWTGKGCHSADTPILMYDGSIKCAKDIKIGDVLMGDNSTPRNVQRLFRGTQDMFRVTLADGSYYEGNGDHRMALKCVFESEIYFETTSETYVVVFHKLKNEIPTKHETYFRTKNMTKESALEEAKKYMQRKREKSNFIERDVIIPVKINQYDAIEESIKKYYKHFRNPIQFDEMPVTVDPYKVGTSLGTTSIPRRYKINSTSVRMNVLAGILDKWGTIANDHVVISAQNREFRDDCVFLCRSLGFHVSVSNINIYLSGVFRNLPTRKFKIYEEKYNASQKLEYDFQITQMGSGEFYGFAVDGNERYVLQNFTVTYNSNGKSLLMVLIQQTFGNYYKTMEPTVLTRKRGSSSNATPELADKQGVRIIFMSESEEDDKLYSSNMKRMTSFLDEICARQLFQVGFEFKPQFKMVMVCNELPEIFGKDNGTWRRIRVVPFIATFVDGEPRREYEFTKDKKLGERIGNWKQPFMWLLLRKYYPRYIKEGLNEPKEVQTQTKKYRNDNDFYNEKKYEEA